MPGALERNEKNEPVRREAFAVFEDRAVRAKSVIVGKANLPLDRRMTVRPLAKGVQGKTPLTTDRGLVVGGRVRLGRGEILALGWDAGALYGNAWVKDFAGVAEKENADAVEDNAYANMRPERVADGAVALLPTRAVAAMFRDFARAHGARASVRCGKYTDAIAALRCRSFRQGDRYLVGIANRMVRPGKKFAETWPSDYHVTVKDLDVELRLDEPTKKLFGVAMPLARPQGEGR